MGVSRHTALRTLLRIPLPTGRIPRVIGVDDFALRRHDRYATVIIDAGTHERIDVLADRTADTLEAWLRAHRGVEVVCRDGSATYAEAIRRALPDAVQVGDRWHVWHDLCEAALSEVKTAPAGPPSWTRPSATAPVYGPPWPARCVVPGLWLVVVVCGRSVVAGWPAGWVVVAGVWRVGWVAGVWRVGWVAGVWRVGWVVAAVGVLGGWGC